MNTTPENRNTRRAPTPEVQKDRFAELTRAMVDRFFERRNALAFCVVDRHAITEIVALAMQAGRIVGQVEGYADGLKTSARANGR